MSAREQQTGATNLNAELKKACTDLKQVARRWFPCGDESCLIAVIILSPDKPTHLRIANAQYLTAPCNANGHRGVSWWRERSEWMRGETLAPE